MPVEMPSASPSVTPTATTGAPRVTVRKSGMIGYTISVAASVKKLTQPRLLTTDGSGSRVGGTSVIVCARGSPAAADRDVRDLVRLDGDALRRAAVARRARGDRVRPGWSGRLEASLGRRRRV